MRSTAIAAVVLVGGVLGLAGCGGSSSTATSAANERPRTTPAERREAGGGLRGALIGRRDLPPDWVPRPPLPSGVRCGSWDPFDGATRRLASPRFNQGLVDIEQTLAVFPSADAGSRAYRRLNATATERCMRRALRARLRNGGYISVGPVTVALVDAIGDHSRTVRYRAPLVSEFSQEPGLVVTINARVGRAVSTLTVVAGHFPLADAEYGELAELVERKLEAVLG